MDGDSENWLFPLYRLWIEHLAEQKDLSALSALVPHLRFMSENSPNQHEWVGLRGLVHLELDEIQACNLIDRVFKDRVESNYAREFCYRFHLRRSGDEDLQYPYFESEITISDYFHFDLFAKEKLLSGDFDGLQMLLQKCETTYPRFPFVFYIGVFRNLKRAIFKELYSKHQFWRENSRIIWILVSYTAISYFAVNKLIRPLCIWNDALRCLGNLIQMFFRCSAIVIHFLGKETDRFITPILALERFLMVSE